MLHSIIFRPFVGPVDLPIWPKNDLNRYFWTKMVTQGQWYGFKMVLMKFISALDIPNDFSMEPNALRTLIGSLDLLFGSENGLKQCLCSKMASQVQLFGLKLVLIEIPNNFSKEFNTFGTVTGSLDLHSGTKICLKSLYLVKMTTQCQWFGFKIVLIKFICALNIPNEIS